MHLFWKSVDLVITGSAPEREPMFAGDQGAHPSGHTHCLPFASIDDGSAGYTLPSPWASLLPFPRLSISQSLLGNRS